MYQVYINWQYGYIQYKNSTESTSLDTSMSDFFLGTKWVLVHLGC